MAADSLSGLLAVVGMAASLTVSVALSAYRSRHYAAALAFLLLCYVNLLSLFLCAKWLVKLEPDGSPETRSRLRTAVWALASALAISFACRVGLDMPWPLAVVVLSLSAAISFGGFYGMFVYAGGHREHGDLILQTTHAADDVEGQTEAVPNSSTTTTTIEEMLVPAVLSFMINLSSQSNVDVFLYYPLMIFNLLGILSSMLLIMLSLAKCRVTRYAAAEQFGLILGLIFFMISLVLSIVGLFYRS